MEYMSSVEAAEKWGLTSRRVTILCNENRIDGAVMVGKVWLIPRDAKKPDDKWKTRYQNTGEVNKNA